MGRLAQREMQGHTATVRHRLGEPTVRVLVVAVLALLAATTGAGGAVAADPPPGWVAAEVEPVVLWAGEATEVPDVLAPAGRASAVTATFQVNWTGAPPTAVRDAVAEATRLWSTQVVSSVPIRIHASWPVTIAAPRPPLLSPIRATMRSASRQRRALTVMARRRRQGAAGSAASPGSPRANPTPPTRSNQASRAKS